MVPDADETERPTKPRTRRRENKPVSTPFQMAEQMKILPDAISLLSTRLAENPDKPRHGHLDETPPPNWPKDEKK